MDSNHLFYIIISILIIQYVIETFLDYLNAQRYQDPIPHELEDVFNEEEYQKSQEYKKTNYRFGLVSSTFSLFLTLSFLTLGGFNYVDQWIAILTDNSILKALLFFGIILIGSDIITTPFSYYQTFVIEEKFGFNKSTFKLFLLDKIKGWCMMVILGGGLLALIIWFFQWAGSNFWIYAWSIIAVVTIFMNLFYSKLIVPLFNKQEALQEGDLKSKIQDYAETVGFALDNIYVMDGSKRSTKANAYFSGFGKEKRVTLYDTLIKDLEEEEIVAVLAHEVGHYKKKHILFNLFASILLTGVTLFLLSLFINTPEVSLAIGVSKPSFHAALIGFGILYSPISEITALIMNYLSRKFEYQADDYAKSTYKAKPLITGLKKLSKKSLSNLTPHPSYVFMHYSHPPLINRIHNLKV
ncbi:M48 family metallopeptidase [uncultured Maribacter sp.]|uniref:M48 family metallopeptidase n=1 Tax=uncultured Maribacter sp. TaxID=431308 RepID=UPI002634016D|nr:M48 family metallopeptidase [uncultured Maribacter sp.]